MTAWHARRGERWEFARTVAPVEMSEISGALFRKLRDNHVEKP